MTTRSLRLFLDVLFAHSFDSCIPFPLVPFYSQSLIGLSKKTDPPFTIILKLFRLVSSQILQIILLLQ